jgi:hypothetical protein
MRNSNGIILNTKLKYFAILDLIKAIILDFEQLAFKEA